MSTLTDNMNGHVFVCNGYENVDWFVKHSHALYCLGVRNLLFFGELYTNAENPMLDGTGAPTYQYTHPNKIHNAELTARANGMNVCCYVNPYRWQEAGGTEDNLYRYVATRQYGVFADGFQIHGSSSIQMRMARKLRIVVEGKGPLIGHLSLEYHQRHEFPECADCCNYVLVGEQPTFSDWNDQELKKTHRPWFHTLIKWPTWPEEHPLNLNGDGYLRWVSDGGRLFLHQGAQIREWCRVLGFDREMVG